MGKYTQTLREIAQGMMNEEKINVLSNEELIDTCCSKFFDNNYPIWSEQYRDTLNRNIVRHFFTREIGYETYGLWRFKFNTKLKEIMPFFNKLYEEIEGHDLFNDTDLWNRNDESKASLSNTDKSSEDNNTFTSNENTNTLNGSEHLSNSTSKDSGTDRTVVDYNSSDTKTDTEVKEHVATYNKQNETQETFTKTSSEKETKTGTETSEIGSPPSIVKTSDTPQGTISDLKAGKYLTEVTITDSNGTLKTPTTYNTTIAHSGSPAEKKIVYKDGPTSQDINVDKTTSGSIKNVKDGDDTTILTHGKQNDTNQNETTYERGQSDTVKKDVGKNEHSGNEKTTTGEEMSGIQHSAGKAGGKPYIELLRDFYSDVITVELMLFDKLEECFMSIW